MISVTSPDRTLLLLRHAKSDYPDGVADHDRPLAPRGIREAALAGDWIRANAPPVDAVLCSTATRTRQTLARTGIDAEARFDDALYDSSPGTVIRLINGVADDVARCWSSGTNPPCPLALGLADPGPTSDSARRTSDEVPDVVDRRAADREAVAPTRIMRRRLVAFHVPRCPAPSCSC